MKEFPPAFDGLARYRQFITYMLVPSLSKPGAADKVPVSPVTLHAVSPMDPANWMDKDTAMAEIAKSPVTLGLGFVFTMHDPFFFLDIDKCLIDEHWSPLADQLMDVFKGAAFEVSQSGKGLHIIGSGACPPHGCKNKTYGIELYTESRFVALTGDYTEGHVDFNCASQLKWLVNTYFGKPDIDESTEWTHQPVPEWNGPQDDDVLINKMCAQQQTAMQVFGGKASFEALFNADVDALAVAYPDANRPYDESSADMALASHLAFWTGKNHERMKNIMLRSKLVRGKWDREDYMRSTIMNACAMCTQVYSMSFNKGGIVPPPIMAEARSGGQVALLPAELTQVPGGSTQVALPGSGVQPPATQEATAVTPGVQYMPAALQPEYFRGCVYVRDQHKILVPDGTLLKPDQFRAMYAGYSFAKDLSNSKVTTSAWEAFIESQAFKFPKVSRHVFRPELPPLKIFSEEGETVVNSYVPIETPRRIGDPGPFLDLVERLLPNLRDRQILMSYMAACVQYPGIKFQWCPILQGTEGNGKSTLSRAVAFAVGKRYSHFPNATDIANKFNGWISEKLFIGVEEIYTQEKQELLSALYPMITNDQIEIQMKGGEKFTGDNRANFMMNTNHQDAVKVSADTRRWCMFYTAQQTAADKARYGMGGSYFPQLYRWLKYDGGYEIINEYLHTYPIQDDFNPAGVCVEAPRTTAFLKASEISTGRIEQEVIEAINMNMQGFRGHWVSSYALDRFLRERQLAKFVPMGKRRELMVAIGYDYHPRLEAVGGRSPLGIMAEGNTRPILYSRVDSPPFARDPIEARNKYVSDQGYEQPNQ